MTSRYESVAATKAYLQVLRLVVCHVVGLAEILWSFVYPHGTVTTNVQIVVKQPYSKVAEIYFPKTVLGVELGLSKRKNYY